MPPPSVIEQQLIFTVADPGRSHVTVRLDCDDALAGPRRFRRTSGGWVLAMPRPELLRVEYRLVVLGRDGATHVILDPDNPELVRTAFGDRSVALLPGYKPPWWLAVEHDAGELTEIVHTDPTLGDLPITVWAPSSLAPSDPAPLLVVNDGPEYAELAAVTRYAAALQDAGSLPAFRVALMHPLDRDEWYAANPVYRAAASEAIRQVMADFATDLPLVAMGASLGGLSAVLTALEADHDVPYGGVFAQSGSFFQATLDPQESTYPYFEQVSAATSEVSQSGPAQHPLTIGLTCGALEENLANNQAMAAALAAQGHRVVLRELPDLHNYTAWRDALDPGLTDVLRAAWGTQG
jgi:enterochelin esterase-like enzyme